MWGLLITIGDVVSAAHVGPWNFASISNAVNAFQFASTSEAVSVTQFASSSEAL